VESLLGKHPLARSPTLEARLATLLRKQALHEAVRTAKKEARAAAALICHEDLKARRRVLRRLDYTDKQGVVTLKASRAANCRLPAIRVGPWWTVWVRLRGGARSCGSPPCGGSGGQAHPPARLWIPSPRAHKQLLSLPANSTPPTPTTTHPRARLRCLQGRFAAELSTGDELVLTEMVFQGAFAQLRCGCGGGGGATVVPLPYCCLCRYEMAAAGWQVSLASRLAGW
jgi:hypothetical protein